MALEAGQLARNTSYLTMAFILQKVLSYFYFVPLANFLQPGGLGKYSFALSFTSIFSIFMDFGFGPVLTREIAKRSEDEQDYLKKILGVKIILVLLSLGAMAGVLAILDQFRNFTTEEIELIGVAAIITVLDTMTFTFYSVFRGRQIMKYEAIGIIIYQFIIVSVGSLAIFYKQPISIFLWAIVAGSVFNFFFSTLIVIFQANLHVRPEWQWSFFRTVLKIAAPFAIAGIFFKLNGQIDTVMLRMLAGNKYVGWYTIAFKLTTALTVLPGALATSYFPAMSYYLTHDPSKAPRTFEKAMLYLMVISVPISFGVFVIGDELILTMHKKAFLASAEALNIFMIGLVAVFLNYPVGNLLNAANKQVLNTINMGIALLVNVVLNILLIPKMTFIGASIAAVASSIVLFLLGLPHVYRIVRFNIAYLLKKFSQIILGGLVMALVLTQLQDKIHVALLIPLGAVLYGIMLLGLGTIKREDYGSVLDVIKRLARKVA